MFGIYESNQQKRGQNINRPHLVIISHAYGVVFYDISSYYRYNNINARKVYGGVYIGANVAATSIFDAVESLFRYVEPSKDNLSAFGP